jgi:predicted glycosyltransferase involved in capsule biosynthesis
LPSQAKYMVLHFPSCVSKCLANINLFLDPDCFHSSIMFICVSNWIITFDCIPSSIMLRSTYFLSVYRETSTLINNLMRWICLRSVIIARKIKDTHLLYS